jgi:hypothetical protein
MFGPTQQWQEAKLTVWVNSFFIGKYWLKWQIHFKNGF